MRIIRGEALSFVRKGAWSPEEDAFLLAFVAIHGPFGWNSARGYFPSLCRTGKSCRLRYLNQLRPGIRRQPVSPEEEDRIIQLHRVLGNQWSRIAAHLPGWTDSTAENGASMVLRRARRQLLAGSRRFPRLGGSMPSGVLNVTAGMSIAASSPSLPLQGGVPGSCQSEVLSAREVQSLLPAAGPSSQNGNVSAALHRQLPSVQSDSGGQPMVPELIPSILVDNDVVLKLAAKLGDTIVHGNAAPALAVDKNCLEAVYAGKPHDGGSSRHNARNSAGGKQVIDDSFIGTDLHRCTPEIAMTPTLQMTDLAPASPQQDFAMKSVENGSPAAMVELDMGTCELASDL